MGPKIVALHLFCNSERLTGQMRRPPIGEYNMGALAGAVVGSIGGLFAIGVVRAILGKNIALLLSMPMLGLLSWLVCGLIGWFVGGQIGPRMGERYYSQQAELLGGAVGGLIPVLLVAVWAWHMSTR
jgi:hypothetical protein